MDLECVAKMMSPAPIVIEPEAPLGKAWRLMAEHQIRHIPVVSPDGLVGVITDRDVREALPSPASEAEAAEFAVAMDRMAVWDVMTEQVITVTPQTPLAQAAHLLARRKIGCLPVMESDRLVGIVTKTDMLRAFAELLDDLSGWPRFEVAVEDIAGRLQEISRLFADSPAEIGTFVGAWTEGARLEKAPHRVLVLRFQAFQPQEILRILEGAGIPIVSVRHPGSHPANSSPVSDAVLLK